MRLLLLSNSTQAGRGFLDHAAEAVRKHLAGGRRLLFVPFALADVQAYTQKVADRMRPWGIEVRGWHSAADPLAALAEAEAVFVGGGNTFRLLRALQERRLVAPLAAAVRAGLPYLGASAGTNLACPTIRTTNDMPIVQPESFEALGLIPFQINPHYRDPDPGSSHMGETRETRLREYLEENESPVLGLREGGWVRVDDEAWWLEGERPARVFRRGGEPVEIRPPADLRGWLQ